MRAITIYARYASSLVLGTKTIENRSWRIDTPQTLLIHAGRTLGELSAGQLEDDPETMTRTCHPGHIVGIVRFSRCVRPDKLIGDPWTIGPWCWVADRRLALAQPILCPGSRGLWDVHPTILERVLRQLKK